MSDGASPDAAAQGGSSEEVLAELLSRWFEVRYAGGVPELDEICADVSEEVKEELRRLLALQDGLSGFDGDSGAGQAGLGHLAIDSLGGCRLRGRIGSGGMGDVYLAVQEPLGREVAVKVLRPEFAADPVRRLRFRREAEIAAALDHPHIVPVYGSGVDQGHHFLVMKLLRGETLHELAGRLSTAEVASLGAQVADALHAAHEVGVLHRDLKPANVIAENGSAFVLDFGLARSRLDLTLTSVGQVAGTIAYMAPEHLQRRTEPVDPRIDVYGLGATLYHVVAGRPPFGAERPEALLREVLVKEPPALGLAGRESELETVILRAMDKDPARRMQSAAELRDELLRFVRGEPVRSRPIGLPTRVLRLAKRNPWNAASIAVALLAVVALGAVLGFQAWRSARDFEQALSRIDAELAAGRSAVALQRLGELDAPRLRSEPAARRFRVATARLRREALLDALQADRRYWDRDYLGGLRGDPGDWPEEVREEPASQLAEALFAVYAADDRSLGRCLDSPALEAAYPVTVDLLRAVARAEPLPAPAESLHRGDAAAEDRSFAALVRLMRERPNREIEAELRAALTASDVHARALFGLGTLHMLEGDAERGRECFAGAARGRPESAAVAIAQARAACRLGDRESAIDHLRRAEQVQAASGLPTSLQLELLWLDLHLMDGDLDALERRLGAALMRWPACGWLYLTASHARLAQDDVIGAESMLERGLELADGPLVDRRLHLALLQLRAGKEMDFSEFELLTAEVEEFVATAREVEEPAILADALWLLGALKDAEGDGDAASRCVAEVLLVEPLHPAANLAALQSAVDGAGGDLRIASDSPGWRHAEIALAQGQALLARAAIDRGHLTLDEVLEAEILVAALAAVLARNAVALDYGARAARSSAGLPHDEQADLLEAVRRRLGLDSWGEPVRR